MGLPGAENVQQTLSWILTDPRFLADGRWCHVQQPQLEASHYSHLFAILPHLNCQADILHHQHKQGRCRWEVGRQTKTT